MGRYMSSGLFIVCAIQRSGSTMLTRTLNTHPRIRCLDEVFINRFPNRNIGSYQEYIRGSISTRIKHILSTETSVNNYLTQLESKPIHLFVSEGERSLCQRIGFKLMLTDVKRMPMVLDFAKRNGIQLIHLIRENSLDILISMVRNKISRIPHLPKHSNASESYRPDKVVLKTRTLIRNLEKIEASKRMWLELLKGCSYSTVLYEEIIRNRAIELKKLMKTLGVEDTVDLETPLRKIGPSELSRSVDNFDEVVRFLRGSAYARYLHD